MALVKFNSADLFPTFSSIWDDFFGKDMLSKGIELGTTLPAANITEEADKFLIDLAVPGCKKEDFKVSLENDVLVVSSEKKEEKEEEKKDYKRKEFSYTSFVRSFTLPQNVKKEGISAEYKEGILKITVPKLQPTPKTETSKKIEVV